MTGLRRTMGFVIALAALQAPLWAVAPDEFSDSFKQGVDLWQRGREAEAIAAFNKALANNPTEESAYALWRDVDFQVWRELIASGGQGELIAKRVIELAKGGRKALANDSAAIEALVQKVVSLEGGKEWVSAVGQLASDHGEFATPNLIGFLGEGSESEKMARAKLALNRLSRSVVLPLCAALQSQDAVLRRNICDVLGGIGDDRAAGYLLWHAKSDPDGSVRAAAADAARAAGFGGDALSSLLKLGQEFHDSTEHAIPDNQVRESVWVWNEPRLVPMPIPAAIHNDELARQAYDHALSVAPDSTDALAGLARAYVAEMTKLEWLEKGGQDLGAWKARIDEARLAVNVAGVNAVDRALQLSVQGKEGTTGAALCRTLAGLAKEPTPGLNAALQASDGALRSEAAVALASIAQRNGRAPSSEVIALLGEIVGRQVMRIAIVADSDEGRGRAIQAGLEGMGMSVTRVTKGGMALALARRAAGLDVALFSDVQSDLTLSQMLDEMKDDPRLQAVPIVAITANPEQVATDYSGRIAGSVKGADDLKAVQDAMSNEIGGDRALADDLAARAGAILAQVGRTGRADTAPVAGSVVGAIANRPDAVSIAALEALASAGGAQQGAAIVAVVADGSRSEPVRVAAADALAGILARDGSALAAESVASLNAVAVSDAGVKVRDAVARAIGLVKIDAAQRIDVLRKLKGGSGGATNAAEGN